MMLVLHRSSSGIPIDRLTHVLSQAIWMPTDDKVSRLIAETYRGPTAALYAWKDAETADVIGPVGIRRRPGGAVDILHVAVAETSRRRGVGRRMIEALRGTPGVRELVAETDGDAVDFYRRCGFTVTSLGDKYPGRERFRCVLRMRASRPPHAPLPEPDGAWAAPPGDRRRIVAARAPGSPTHALAP
jgi:GNAT superfamily N-acetyltransferase